MSRRGYAATSVVCATSLALAACDDGGGTGGASSGAGPSTTAPSVSASTVSSAAAGTSTVTTGSNGVGGSSDAGSLVFHVNDGPDDYGMLTTLPPTFGTGELTFELWVKPNHTLPVGEAGGTSTENWSSSDPQPDPAGAWWYAGNFLLDGHGNGGAEQGTFDLQIYGAGRVRWLFHDGQQLWGVQAWPATDAPSILDGGWHHVAAVRRFVGATDAQLELWVDGVIVGQETSPLRTDMRTWWDTWSTFPPEQPGWFLGAEKISSTGGAYWDDYKGNVAELRFWDVAKSADELATQWQLPISGDEPGLVGWFPLQDGSGTSSCDVLTPSACVELFPQAEAIWSMEGPPLD